MERNLNLLLAAWLLCSPAPLQRQRSLLQPLSWSHVYVPLLPRRMAADLLQCPTPFILGLEAATARELELPKDAIQASSGASTHVVGRSLLRYPS